MVQAIQVLRFHLLELEKVSFIFYLRSAFYFNYIYRPCHPHHHQCVFVCLCVCVTAFWANHLNNRVLSTIIQHFNLFNPNFDLRHLHICHHKNLYLVPIHFFCNGSPSRFANLRQSIDCLAVDDCSCLTSLLVHCQWKIWFLIHNCEHHFQQGSFFYHLSKSTLLYIHTHTHLHKNSCLDQNGSEGTQFDHHHHHRQCCSLVLANIVQHLVRLYRIVFVIFECSA